MQAAPPGLLTRSASPCRRRLCPTPVQCPPPPISTEELLEVIQERMEFVACQAPAGSAAQHVMAEFVNELRRRALEALAAEEREG